MTERGRELHATADEQIADLIDFVAKTDAAALRLPCSGREKLGDGTVGASLRHTADNYQRIADFVQTSDRMSGAHAATPDGAHRIPRFLRAIGHGPRDHAEHGPGVGQHDDQYTADAIDPRAVITQLSDSRHGLGRIAEMTDCLPPYRAPRLGERSRRILRTFGANSRVARSRCGQPGSDRDN